MTEIKEQINNDAAIGRSSDCRSKDLGVKMASFKLMPHYGEKCAVSRAPWISFFRSSIDFQENNNCAPKAGRKRDYEYKLYCI